jgi:DHA1 family inner membrane transport protein
MPHDATPSALAGRPPKTKLPFIVPLLALGTFLMCTTEFVIAGLLPQMADDFGVRPSQIGLLITAFAIGMIVGAPVMAIATLRLPRRGTLVLALAIFAAGHVIGALSDSYGVLLVARVVTAVVTGAFWSVATVVATTAAGPADEHGPAPSVGSELRALRSAPLWLVMGATVLVMGGCMAAFSYIAPLLTERAGISLGLVPLVFVCFGIGSVVGTNVAGRVADRRPVATFIAAAAGAALILVLLIPLSANAVTAVILITLLGGATMALPPVSTGLTVQLARSAPTLAAALSVSAFNAGTAAGSSIGGYTLDTSLGTTGPATVGVIMVALGLVPLIALATKRVRLAHAAARERELRTCVALGGQTA